MTINILCSFFILFLVSGCYTQLMTPKDYLKIRSHQSAAPIADNSYSINYNQSCTSCHSIAELNERAEELEYYGIQTVHNGILLSDRDWLGENPIIVPSPDPGPIYWPTPIYPTNPWWIPPVIVVTTPDQPKKGNRPRTEGSTRDKEKNGERERPIPTSPTPVPAPTPTAQPPAPVGGTPTTPVTTAPAPAVIVTPSQPASTPSQPAESGRTRDTSSDGNTTTTKTRNDGSSRDSNGGSRPR